MSGGDIIPDAELSRFNTAWLASRVAALERRLAASQAALRASTELLRELQEVTERDKHPGWPNYCQNQIAANEAVLGGG